MGHTQQPLFEKAADEALDATTSHRGEYDSAQGKTNCLEFPCKVE
jgi:hypothetical protein